MFVFDLVQERDNFLKRLDAVKNKPATGGWEKMFISGNSEISVNSEASEWIFHGMKLNIKKKRRS